MLKQLSHFNLDSILQVTLKYHSNSISMEQTDPLDAELLESYVLCFSALLWLIHEHDV